MTTTPITPELRAELRAMNVDPNTPPCPPWCTLEPHHGWDSTHDDGRESRGHSGPTFGRFVSVGSREFADRAGHHVMEIDVDEGIDGKIDDPEEARRFAADVIEAASWVSHKNAFELGRDWERGLHREKVAELEARLDQCDERLGGLQRQS